MAGLEIRFVTRCDPTRERGADHLPLHHGAAVVAALRDEAYAPAIRMGWRFELFERILVGIWPQDTNTMPPGRGRQLRFVYQPIAADLAESRREHQRGSYAPRTAFIKQGDRRRRRGANEGQINVPRHILKAGSHREHAVHAATGVYEINRAAKAQVPVVRRRSIDNRSKDHDPARFEK